MSITPKNWSKWVVSVIICSSNLSSFSIFAVCSQRGSWFTPMNKFGFLALSEFRVHRSNKSLIWVPYLFRFSYTWQVVRSVVIDGSTRTGRGPILENNKIPARTRGHASSHENIVSSVDPLFLWCVTLHAYLFRSLSIIRTYDLRRLPHRCLWLCNVIHLMLSIYCCLSCAGLWSTGG